MKIQKRESMIDKKKLDKELAGYTPEELEYIRIYI